MYQTWAQLPVTARFLVDNCSCAFGPVHIYERDKETVTTCYNILFGLPEVGLIPGPKH